MLGPLVIVVALIAAALLALVVELVVLPGHGVGAVAAAVLALAGVAFAWWRFGASWGMGSLLLAAGAAATLLRVLPKTRAGRALVLDEVVATPVETTLPVGAEGVTLTALRPSGAAEIAGRRWDVMTDGVFVESGRAVRVVSVQGARIVVAPI